LSAAALPYLSDAYPCALRHLPVGAGPLPSRPPRGTPPSLLPHLGARRLESNLVLLKNCAKDGLFGNRSGTGTEPLWSVAPQIKRPPDARLPSLNRVPVIPLWPSSSCRSCQIHRIKPGNGSRRGVGEHGLPLVLLQRLPPPAFFQVQADQVCRQAEAQTAARFCRNPRDKQRKLLSSSQMRLGGDGGSS
jgi:hypothetical protein